MGDSVSIWPYPGTGFEVLNNEISGKIVAKFGNLYIVQWTLIFHSSRLLEFQILDQGRDYNNQEHKYWHYLAWSECLTNVNPGVSPSLALSPTPTPTPSSSSITQPGGSGAPSNSRSGYSCAGPTYGHGTYRWSQTYSVGSFPYWKGPNMTLRCISGTEVYQQEWMISVSGWGGCTGPTYTARSFRYPGTSYVQFIIGSGTVIIHFDGVSSARGSDPNKYYA